MRLEQRDSYLRRFWARVREVRRGERGTWVALEASAFYPTSGGQPHDTGRLGGAVVTDVSLADGQVWHLVGGDAPASGDEVEGAIDWDRRYRHMQRHTAQHLLSQAFVRVSPAFETRSVSLRNPDCTLDLAGEPDDAALEAAEALVNEFAFAALPVVAFEVDEGDVGGYPVRRPPKVRGRIRLVAMGDVELAACGGTHLAGTAEAGPIKLLSDERVRDGLRRVSFRAGWDAIDDYRAKHALATGLVQRFSAPVAEVEARVERLEADAAEARAALRAERGERAARLAASLLEGARHHAGVRLVASEVDPAMLDPLSELFLARPATVALLAARDEAGARVSFVHGPGAALDVLPALRAAVAVLGGRGGGRPERAQGAGPNVGAVEEALRIAIETLERG